MCLGRPMSPGNVARERNPYRSLFRSTYPGRPGKGIPSEVARDTPDLSPGGIANVVRDCNYLISQSNGKELERESGRMNTFREEKGERILA
ncbi:hypothetical protein Tco_0448777 [Tanacetum coccineum]